MTAPVYEPHGTNSGYQAHIDYRTPPCGPCKQAHADAERRRRHVLPLLSEVIAVLAEALEVEDRCGKCPECLRALSPRRRTCQRCGAPVSPGVSRDATGRAA